MSSETNTETRPCGCCCAVEEQARQKIRRQIEANVHYLARRLDRIEQRLNELDREWDVEHALTGDLASAGVLGVLGAMIYSRKCLVLPLVAGVFQLQHVFTGWCPVVPLYRWLGIRTRNEIDRERYALKALRGDFSGVGPESQQEPEAKAQKALDGAEPSAADSE